MTSWRDSASQQAQNDLDELVSATLPFAKQNLDEHGEFFPYAAAITSAGELKLVAGDPGKGEQPESADVLNVLAQGLRADRDNLRACALVSDVRVSGADAVRVECEHQEGQAIVMFLPYNKRRFGRGVDYGELAAGSADGQIW